MKKYIIIAILSLISLTIVFILNSANKKKSNITKYRLSENDTNSKLNEKKSLFDEDSKFLDFPNITEVEFKSSSDLTEAELKERKKIIIEKSKYLADLFPNNSVIPRQLTPTQEKIIQENELKMTRIRNKALNSLEISKEEKNFYYTNRLKTTSDRVEIFEYVLGRALEGKFEIDKLDPILKERYNDLLQSKNAYQEELDKLNK
jgi:hypothetical protein